MKKSLLGLAVAFSVANAHAYSDAGLASVAGLSVFDMAYENEAAAKQAPNVKYTTSEVTQGAVIDLSLDEPVITVEETETERRYRKVLTELEQNRIQLDAARADAERVVENAHAEVVAKADARVLILENQRLEIEAQRQSVESQRATISAQLAKINQQEARVNEALALNEKAMSDADTLKIDGAQQVAMIKQESQQILMLAENSAVAIETAAKQRVQLERIDPTVVLNEPVQVEFQSATMEEIARAIMPSGWRIQTEFAERPEIEDRRYQFISTDPRDFALRKLTASVRDARVTFAYFWDLTDAAGNPAPMLLITARAK